MESSSVVSVGGHCSFTWRSRWPQRSGARSSNSSSKAEAALRLQDGLGLPGELALELAADYEPGKRLEVVAVAMPAERLSRRSGLEGC